jgi:hypothetical protein
MPSVPLIGWFREVESLEVVYQSLLQEHLGDTAQSAEQYSWSREVALGAEVLKRRRIYLDTKFWIYLRNALGGAPAEPSHAKLLELLLDQVQSGRAICPLADCAFIELWKQRDRQSRLATARVMDVLSQGVSIRSYDDRIRAEILHFLRRHTSGLDQIYPLEQMIWTRVGFVVGGFRPVYEDVPPALGDALAKTFDDHVWMSTLEEMVLDEQGLEVGSDFYVWLKERLNGGMVQHESEIKSYRSAYRAELRGAIDIHWGALSEALPYLYQRAGGAQQLTEPEKVDSGRILGNLIYEALARHEELRDLPTINIQAGIHASIRWDKQRSYSANDWLDILHAAAGMPYCDVFLTERSLASLLRSSHLAYDKRYQTKVYHTLEEAVASLEERAT